MSSTPPLSDRSPSRDAPPLAPASGGAPAAGPDFIFALGHDLRSPLNSVIGLSEALLEAGEPFDPVRTARYLGMIKGSGRRLLALLNDLMELTQLDAGRVPIEAGCVDLGQCCAVAVDHTQHELKEKNLSTELLVGTEPVRVLADERLLQRALHLLITRAVNVTPAGGRLHLGVEREAAGLAITLRDGGPRVRSDSLEELLRPIPPEAGRGASHFGASELGLALADRLVRLQGGHLSIRPETPAGNTVAIRFPASALVL